MFFARSLEMPCGFYFSLAGNRHDWMIIKADNKAILGSVLVKPTTEKAVHAFLYSQCQAAKHPVPQGSQAQSKV